jgi:hypothetical protein
VGFVAPTACEDTGSDLHRAYLTRLCSAYGLSQPLDALLLPNPARLCFTPVTLMGFALQRLSPLASRPCLSTPSAPPDVGVSEAFAAWRAALPPEGSRAAPEPRTLRPSPCRNLQSHVPLQPSEEVHGSTRAHRRHKRAFRGSNLTRDPFVRSAMVSRTTGADPLLGFQPSRVFPLPATRRPTPTLLPCASPDACRNKRPKRTSESQ